jgi:hypothetical protein
MHRKDHEIEESGNVSIVFVCRKWMTPPHAIRLGLNQRTVQYLIGYTITDHLFCVCFIIIKGHNTASSL